MADLRSKHLIVGKGLMFFAITVLASALLFARTPEWRTAALLAVLVWASARSYYFLFYVLERYVDPTLRYAGLFALVQALVRRRNDRGRR